MKKILQSLIIIVTNLITLFKQEKQQEPVRLEKKINLEKPRKRKTKKFKFNMKLNYTNILIILGVVIILTIAILIVFRFGALESTQVYNYEHWA